MPLKQTRSTSGIDNFDIVDRIDIIRLLRFQAINRDYVNSIIPRVKRSSSGDYSHKGRGGCSFIDKLRLQTFQSNRPFFNPMGAKHNFKSCPLCVQFNYRIHFKIIQKLMGLQAFFSALFSNAVCPVVPESIGVFLQLSAISRFFQPYTRILFSLQHNRLSLGDSLLKKISE